MQGAQVTLNFGLDELVMIGAASVVLVVLVLALVLSMRPKTKPLTPRQYSAELFKRRLALEELGMEAVHSIRVKDAKGKPLAIDHMIRLPASVLLITSAPADIAGAVKATANAGAWRYARADGSVASFLNPVLQLQPVVQAIRSRFPLVRIRVMTVFPRTARFQGPPPRGCCLADDVVDLVRHMAQDDGPASPVLDKAWEPLAKALSGLNGGQSAPPPPGGRRAVG